jgi:hypothetical protein
MALLRDLVAVRRAAGRPLKVVLMSATLDSALFADYFGACPVLHAQVRGMPEGSLAAFAMGRHMASVAREAWANSAAAVPNCQACQTCPTRAPRLLSVRACLPACLQGRTFPVEQLFLEDCYEATGDDHSIHNRATSAQTRDGSACPPPCSLREPC